MDSLMWPGVSRLSLLVTGFMLLALLTGARHRVRSGETYASLSAAYGVDEARLRSVNPDVDELTSGNVITIPELPAQHAWSAAHPYAPPTPTVSQLLQEIDLGTVKAIEQEGKPGTFVMYAGANLDVEIGSVKPRRVGKTRVFDIYLNPTTGQAGHGTASQSRTAVRPLRLGRTPHFTGRCGCLQRKLHALADEISQGH